MQRRRRSAFTFIETVVTVGIIAVLASFIIPSVMQKAESADPVKIANDLQSITTAVQTFSSDVKGQLPGDLEDLINPLLVNASCNTSNPCDSTVTHAQIFSVDQAAQWKGPYLAISISAAPSATIRSGYVAEIGNTIMRYDSFNGTPEFCTVGGGGTGPCPTFNPVNPLFAAVKVTGLDSIQASAVNRLLDGPNETNPQLEGRFRYALPAGSPAWYLVSPVVIP
jgi:type II secretory pathway pseudopilin PulG